MTGRAVKVGRRTIHISNPDKVLFPAERITKSDLVEYYRSVAPRMVPVVKGRPLALERYPDGLRGERIFQQRAPRHFPDWIHRARVREAGGRTLDHVVCDEAATLVYLADQACITPHAWLSRADRPDVPDQVMFDLDPASEDFGSARRAALALRDLLEELGLRPLVKTTGGDGLHVSVPLSRRDAFDEVRAFAREVAQVLVAREPERVTMEQRKAKRRGRLFLDILRNAYGQTAVPAYAVRARPKAAVATPVDWSEVKDARLRPQRFTIRTVPRRLDRDGDPWAGAVKARSLGPARRRLEALSPEGSRHA